jgi:sugar phosphate isomerase/epimerase
MYGRGSADLKGTVKALKATGYKGAVMVEVDYPHDVSVEASSRKNYRVLSSLLRSYG